MVVSKRVGCGFLIAEREDTVAIETKIDKLGGEYKVDEGVELYALWIPVTFEEKEALINKGKADGVDVAKLAANFLRNWMKSEELDEAQLDKVAGGAMTLQQPTLYKELLLTAQKPTLADGRMNFSTVMCPW